MNDMTIGSPIKIITKFTIPILRQLAEKIGVQFLELNSGIIDAEGNMKAEYTVEGIYMHGDG